jgi:hypothetical protein
MASIAQDKNWQQVITRCWTDPKYKQGLMDDPHKVLAQEGIRIPPGTNVVVVEDEPNRVHFVIPAKPGAGVDMEHAAAEAVSFINPAC